MLFLVSMGKTGLSHDIFFEFSVGPFEVVEVEWKSRSNFWGCDLEILQSFLTLFLLYQNGKVDLCMTNGSKVMIYLTLLNFLLHYLQEYSKIWNIAKSNKSELWNHLSYRDLSYIFKVRSQTFRNDCQILRSQPQNLEADCHSTSTTSKGLRWEFKKNVMG